MTFYLSRCWHYRIGGCPEPDLPGCHGSVCGDLGQTEHTGWLSQ